MSQAAEAQGAESDWRGAQPRWASAAALQARAGSPWETGDLPHQRPTHQGLAMAKPGGSVLAVAASPTGELPQNQPDAPAVAPATVATTDIRP